ncbi:MAG: hypothetical protein EA402_05695 [Planctomycetota bacterium]|nr:MAG: hypothetical protein EA402_05695 [Planctomycetota bacterium]
MPIASHEPSAEPFNWVIRRRGSLDQVSLLGSGELRALPSLDRKLWVALACPVRGLDIDSRTLSLIDSDGDGRIRVPEVTAAVSWVVERLADPGLILTAGDQLPIAAIRDDCEEGRRLRRSAQRVIRALGLSAEVLHPGDTGDLLRILCAARFNGDGVITAAASEDEALIRLIGEIQTCAGSVADRSGLHGIDRPTVDRFVADLAAYDAWWRSAEQGSEDSARLLPLAQDTPAAVAALDEVRAKIDDFFARCRVLRFDQGAHAMVDGGLDWSSLAGRDFSSLPSEIKILPLQHPSLESRLDWGLAVNPAWESALTRFRRQVLQPLGHDGQTLDEPTWRAVCQRLEPYRSWAAAKTASAVEPLGIPRIREILASSWLDQVRALIDEDLAVRDEVDGISDVNKLVLYRRDLARLLKNFVTFDDFFSVNASAIFQSGQLYLDERRCDLVLQVDDPATHAPFAALARCCVVYCRCTRAGEQPIHIAAVLMRGDLSQLMPGRAGIYFDRQGRDWDALLLRLSEAPISIPQAFWTPWRKLASFIETQFERLASSREQQVDGAMAGGVNTVLSEGLSQGEAGASPRTPFDIARFAGIFAAIGLAIGAIGGAMGGMLAVFASLAWWQIPLALLGIVLVVSGPSMVLAWLKLRARTLGPLLEGCGWAINGRVHITRSLGRVLTHLKRLPPHSRRHGYDPFGDHSGRRWLLLVLLVIALIVWWGLGASWLFP